MIESSAPPKGATGPIVDPMLGRVLNERFTIVEALGSGGMGRVYKAVQQPLDRLVALKVLNPTYAGDKDPGFQKRFFLEASVTAKLKHPNTVTVIDYGKTEDGVYFIAMEYVEGITLAQLLTQTGPLPWGRALNIAHQIARSLREAHKAGICHRDLKPANVMVVREEGDQDVVKVLDFGLVKNFLQSDAPSTGDTELTQKGVILGSPQYMAPEQARNISDPRSDVYSLGVVLYQMLCGKPPFQAAQSIDVIVKHLREAPPPLRQMLPQHQVPPGVEGIVMRCLEKEPGARFQSMDDFVSALRSGAGAVGGSGPLSGAMSGPRSGPQTGPVSGVHSGVYGAPDASGAYTGPATDVLDVADDGTPRKGKLPLVLGAAGALLAAGVAFVLLRPSAPPPQPPPAAIEAAAAPTAPAPTAPAAVPTPAPAAEAPAAEAPAAAAAPVATAPVRFVVQSEPRGATVLLGSKNMGTTPVTFALPADAAGIASAELTLALEGYQRLTFTAQGAGEVQVRQALKKKQQAPAPAPKAKGKTPGSPGYKDDPYQ